nr:EOG090X0B12 [Moina brachiata]
MEPELSPENTEKLVQFQELSGIDDLERCKVILSRHGWNVEAAIHDHLESEPARSTTITPNMPTFVERNGGIHTGSNRQRRPSENSTIQRIMSSFLTVAFFKITSFVFTLIQPDQRPALTDPKSVVQSFIQTYDQTYGPQHPTFFVGSYNTVLNEAKKELKFLVVYLHSKDHQDTDKFCRQTLSHPDLINYINENCIMWACSVDTNEGYRVSQCLRENSYPFLALIVLRNYKMTVVGRIECYHGPEQTLRRMQTIIRDNEAFLVVARTDRQERSFTQALRQEQDEAYQESLRADREKEERRRREKLLEEERLKEQREADEAEKRQQEELIRRKAEAVNHVPQEPSPDEPGLCRILVRLPKGQKLERRFRRSEHTLKVWLTDYSQATGPGRLRLVRNVPRAFILQLSLPIKSLPGSLLPPKAIFVNKRLTFEQVLLEGIEQLLVSHKKIIQDVKPFQG